MKAPGAVLTTFPIILILNSVIGPTQLTVAWERGLGCKFCSTQIIKLIMTRVRGGLWEDGWGVCLCVHMLGEGITPKNSQHRDTHRPVSPVAPVFVGFLPVLLSATRPHLPSALSTQQWPPMFPQGEQERCRSGPALHTHTTAWLAWQGLHGKLCVYLLACVCACMYQVSSQR